MLLTLLNPSFLIFVLHPRAVIPHLESFTFMKVFLNADS